MSKNNERHDKWHARYILGKPYDDPAPTVKTIMGWFDKPRYNNLVKLYKQAAEANAHDFKENEVEWATDFAKYMIEYLTPKFK